MYWKNKLEFRYKKEDHNRHIYVYIYIHTKMGQSSYSLFKKEKKNSKDNFPPNLTGSAALLPFTDISRNNIWPHTAARKWPARTMPQSFHSHFHFFTQSKSTTIKCCVPVISHTFMKLLYLLLAVEPVMKGSNSACLSKFWCGVCCLGV